MHVVGWSTLKTLCYVQSKMVAEMPINVCAATLKSLYHPTVHTGGAYREGGRVWWGGGGWRGERSDYGVGGRRISGGQERVGEHTSGRPIEWDLQVCACLVQLLYTQVLSVYQFVSQYCKQCFHGFVSLDSSTGKPGSLTLHFSTQTTNYTCIALATISHTIIIIVNYAPSIYANSSGLFFFF